MGTEIARCFVKGKGLVVLEKRGDRYVIEGWDFLSYEATYWMLEDALKRFNEIIYNACI